MFRSRGPIRTYITSLYLAFQTESVVGFQWNPWPQPGMNLHSQVHDTNTVSMSCFPGISSSKVYIVSMKESQKQKNLKLLENKAISAVWNVICSNIWCDTNSWGENHYFLLWNVQRLSSFSHGIHRQRQRQCFCVFQIKIGCIKKLELVTYVKKKLRMFETLLFFPKKSRNPSNNVS